MLQINPEIALGAMKLLADGSASADFGSFGLSKQDWELYSGPAAWVGSDRPLIERINSVISYGTMDVIGVPRFPISAEYLAAIIAMFVHPSNSMVACNWAARAQFNSELADNAPELGAVCATPQQLFAVVLQLLSTDPGQYRLRFFQRTGIQDEEVQKSTQVSQ